MNTIFIPDRGSNNVYHFFIYMISALRHLDYIPDIIYINLKQDYFNKSNNHIYDIIHILYPSSQIIDTITPNNNIPTLIQDPEPISRTSGIVPEAYIYLRNTFLPIINKLNIEKKFSEYIYITRSKDSTRRRLLNDTEIFSTHVEDKNSNQIIHKFEQISMSDIPVIEQIYLFSKAKVIISPHGAALTYIFLCSNDATIIEIASNTMSKLKHFEHIAEVLNINYKRYTDVFAHDPYNYESDMVLRNIPDFLSFVINIYNTDYLSSISTKSIVTPTKKDK